MNVYVASFKQTNQTYDRTIDISGADYEPAVCTSWNFIEDPPGDLQIISVSENETFEILGDFSTPGDPTTYTYQIIGKFHQLGWAPTGQYYMQVDRVMEITRDEYGQIESQVINTERPITFNVMAMSGDPDPVSGVDYHITITIGSDNIIYLPVDLDDTVKYIVGHGNTNGVFSTPPELWTLNIRDRYITNEDEPSQPAWWTKIYSSGDTVKAGTVFRVTHYQDIDSADNYLPGYLIAKEDYTLRTDGIVGPDGDSKYLTFAVNWALDGSGGYGAIDLDNSSDTCIFDRCFTEDKYCTTLPWGFVVEGVVTDYISLQWQDAYNDVGTFSLVLPATDENIDLFQMDRYLMIEKSEKIMIIENTKLNANLMSDGFVLQVSGRSLESILDRRVAFPGMALNTSVYKGDGGVVQAVYDLVNAYFIDVGNTAQESSDGTKYFYYPERKVPFLELPVDRNQYFKRTFNASINKTVCKESLLQIITDICQNNDLGFKIIAAPRYGDSKCITWKFILYNGADKSYSRLDKNDPLLIFSPKLNNVRSVATTIDNSNYKNVIFCGTERDSEGYIDLTTTQPSVTQLLGINMPSVISSVKDKISSKLQKNPVTYTGILICVIAANKNTKSYTQTVESIVDGNDPQVLIGQNGDYDYPSDPITEDQASKITVTFYQIFGQDTSTSKKEKFVISDIENVTTGSGDDIKIEKFGFKGSTAYGWLTPTILQEATSGANSMPSSWSIQGLASSVTKKAIVLWFKTFDAYTSNSSMTKWLCQTYDRSNKESGLDRREVFVEEENNQDDDWDASAINAWRASTTIIKTNSYDDEEDSDEKVNERLLSSARKQSAQFDKIRNVDVDIEPYAYEYRSEYDLGDIVQVDDNHGNLDSYRINAVTISNDTTDGEKIIPEFVRYYSIPKAYTQLEYLRVANMLLPVIFSPRENIANSDDQMNWDTTQPDIGPDITKGYSGYIDEIFWERRSKWTEFEFDGKYDVRVKSDSSFEPLKNNFALLSAIGYNITVPNKYGNESDSEDLLSYALISSRIDHPLMLGRNGQAANGEQTIDEDGTRYFYQFMGDHARCEVQTGDMHTYYTWYTTPGIGIKWEKPESEIQADVLKGYSSTKYIDAIYRKQDDSLRHVFYLNKAILDTSSIASSQYGDQRLLKYSVSYIDSDADTNRLAKKPQFQFIFPYDESNSYYRQISEWDYGHNYNQYEQPYDYNTSYNNAYNNPGNVYQNNPWNRVIYVNNEDIEFQPEDKTALANITSYYRKYVSLTYSGTNAPQEGVYGQVSFNHVSIDEWTSYKNTSYINPWNNSTYRYMVLGGFAYLRRSSSGSGYTQSIIWHSSDNTYEYSDLNNGVVIYRLRVYEYDSSYRDYRWSEYERDSDSTKVTTQLLKFNKSSTSDFRNVESGSENVDISTRHLVHDYIPVKYTDTGDSKPDDNEIYGLYDVVQQEFIPVNFCPNAQLFGETTNSNASFIEAGGEITRE